MEFAYVTITDLSQSPATTLVTAKFNPSEYQIQRNVNYAEVQVPGLQMPLLQFVRGEAQTLQVELFLDNSDRTSGSVHDDLQALRGLVTIKGELHAPPVVQFAWGGESFQGVVTGYTEKFVLFDRSGNVLRARVTLAFKSYTPAEIQYRKLNPQSPDRTKTRVEREGERLDVIAAEEYGDATFWTAIARQNRIARPRVLVPGTVLVIPPL